MNGSTTPRRLGVWAAATSGAAAGLGWLRPDVEGFVRTAGTLGSGGVSAPFETLLAQAAATLAACVLAWLWLVTTLVILELATGVVRDHGFGPAPVRRLVLLACGAGLAATLAAPAGAVPVALPRDGGAHRDHGGDAAMLAGLPLPDRPTSPARSHRPPAQRTHQVRPGESLWSIAAERLPEPAGSDPALVDRAWRALYDHNRALIGADPALIRPGQVLRLPAVTR